MAVTPFQRTLCRLLAADRRARGESYVAGGVALGAALDTRRLSRDLDVFHDTTEAVSASWDHDRTYRRRVAHHRCLFDSHRSARRSLSGYGSGRRMTAFTVEKIAIAAPMPRASVSNAARV